MTALPTLFHIVFVALGAAFSLFYAFKAFIIFGSSAANRPPSWRIHQIWFNFFGSASGWVMLWVLVGKGTIQVRSGQSIQIDGWDAVLFLLAFVGVTGHLPRAVVGLLQGISELAEKIISRAK